MENNPGVEPFVHKWTCPYCPQEFKVTRLKEDDLYFAVTYHLIGHEYADSRKLKEDFQRELLYIPPAIPYYDTEMQQWMQHITRFDRAMLKSYKVKW